MDYTTFGRTGLKVSVAGLGCGGFSRLGMGNGKSEDDAAALVRRAFDRGVNLFDTAAAYGTEAAVGKGLAGVKREQVVICTKGSIRHAGKRFGAADVLASLDNSLRLLRTDYIDVYQLHGVPPELYDAVKDEIVPALLRAREQGKFRFLGITETSPNDPRSTMLQRAAVDGLWDAVMLAFHMMHQNARAALLPLTRANNIGTLLMFAVRGIFARPERLKEAMRELAAKGEVPQALADSPDPLGFLEHAAGASSLTDAAYRFARHEPGIDVVLFGTGDAAHLEANIASLLKPPLPEADRRKLAEMFGHLVGVGLDVPKG
jgi:aryl-alcohol dehydrogenase-like predicted oxidoreductase